MENKILREQFKTRLIREIEEETLVDLQSGYPKEVEGKEKDGMLNYYYKRWLWIQYPWWCINVNESVSSVMEMSVSVSNLRSELVEQMDIEQRKQLDEHFSIEQENELVLNTLRILRDSKARIRGDQAPSKERKKDGSLAHNNETMDDTTAEGLQKSSKKKDLLPIPEDSVGET